VKLYVFDLLHLDDKSLIDTALIERRKLIRTVIQDTELERIEVAKFIVTESSKEARNMFQEVIDLGFEWLMIKNPRSIYTPGKRGIGGFA